MNRATFINVATVGVIFGIGGMTHGFAETLQGNTPTGGMLINAIGAGSSWTRWSAGGEAAFTLLPNFLISGILAMLIGLAIVVWSVAFVHRRYGPAIYLLLFITLFLVGGGIGQVVFFIPAWATATCIHKPLTWWRRALPSGARRGLAPLWHWLLTIASVLVLAALVVAIFGYIPGVQDQEQVLNIMVSMVGVSFVCFLLAFLAGFAYDIEQGAQVGGVRATQVAGQHP